MKKTYLIALAAVLIIVIVGGYLAYTYISNQNAPSNNPSANVSIEQIRDRAMAYIAANYTGTAELMPFSWTGGRQDTGLLGSDVYQYTSQGWNVTMQYPVVADPTYDIDVSYSGQNGTVSWVGKYNGVISETSNSIMVNAPSSNQEDVRDAVMLYIQAYHNQTSPYLQGMIWSGGRMNMGMMVGSETYSYMSGGSAGWAVTMQYPVVPNPAYNVNATYSSPSMINGIEWRGTMQNGVVTEESYNFTP